MTQIVEYILDQFSDPKDLVAKGSGVVGGIIAMVWLDFNFTDIVLLFSWAGLINTMIIFATSATTTIVVLVATDIYKYAKPKTVTFIKAKFIIIKSKCFKNGKKNSSNQRAA